MLSGFKLFQQREANSEVILAIMMMMGNKGCSPEPGIRLSSL